MVLGVIVVAGRDGLLAVWVRSQRREVHIARLVLATIGMGFVLWLLSAELFLIGAICLYCTSVHIFTFILFMLVTTGWETATAAWNGTNRAAAQPA